MPRRRAGSPVQALLGPSTANFTPAMCSSSANALVVFFARSSRAPGAADPEQVLDVFGHLLVDVLADDGTAEVELLDPLGPLRLGHAPRVALVLEVLQHRAGLGRERGLDHDLVAAHVEDVVDVLDVDRALLDAGAAVGAGPQHVRVDDRRASADQAAASASRVRDVLSMLLARSSSPMQAARVRRLGGVVALVEDEHLGRQRLVGVPRRALRLATAALGAGVEVQQALPGGVLDLAAAEDVVLVRSSKSIGLPPESHRLEGAERGAAVAAFA